MGGPGQGVKRVARALVFSHRLFYPRDTVLAAVSAWSFCALSRSFSFLA